MLDDADLDAAVVAGIVTDAQAGALRTFAANRRPRRTAENADEEHFRFMSGFNDFFFAVGIVLLQGGISYFVGRSMVASLVAAAIMWALAELLVARMRLVLPGILLAIFFVGFIYHAVPIDFMLFGSAAAPMPAPPTVTLAILGWFLGPNPGAVVIAKALVAAAAATLFYLRFRLPFALLPVAASLVLAAIAATVLALPARAGAVVDPLILLACGLAVFAVAMRYDMSDRERATRRSDCAFWLHLLAAPLIVHSLISFLFQTGSMNDMGAGTAVGILLIIAVLTVIAIAIDRRALLVSALIYLGAVIAYAISTATAPDRTVVFFSTLIVLGALILALGVGWQAARRRLVSLLSPALIGRLPPVVPI